MNGVLLTSSVCVLLDLDDTLYSEKDYFQSVFATFASQIGLKSEIVPTYLNQFSEVRTNIKDIFSHFLHDQGLYSKENHEKLFEMYRSVITQLSPHNGVDLLINKLLKTQVEVSVLTNGVSAAQKNKWDSLQIGHKESISFYMARELGGDKPNAETFEVWRTLQNVEWSRVVAVGDKYDNDIVYPLEMGASAVLVNTYGHSNKGNDRLSHATNIPDAMEHILTFVGRV